jgi:Ca-activated chloride channel family protein
MEITFVNPKYLWLLAIVPFLILTHFYGLKFSRKKAIKFSNFEALERVTGGLNISMNLPLLLLRLFTLLFLIFALSSPILWYIGKGSNFSFLVAIDSSGSMLADDFSPNRLEAAKESALQFADALPKNSQLAVMGFAGVAFMKQSLTEDINKVKDAISAIKIERSSGTAIGDAIVTGSGIFEANEKGKVIVLLTDGQSNVGTTIEEAIRYANEKFINIYTIGIGTEEGGRFAGIEAISKLDEDSLKSISQNTGGKFYKAQNNQEILQAYNEIARTTDKKIPLKLSLWLIILTFVTLSIEWIIVNTKFRSIP